MPGHKRATKLLGEMDPFDVDFTEIEGLDNLHHPEGILKEAMEEAARYYGTRKTWFLVNGSSCGILAAIEATTQIGETVLIGRNCHKAVYHGALLRNLQVEYVYPEFIPEVGIHGGYEPEIIKKKMEENPQIKVVVITSPTYDGVVSDVSKIAEIVHQHRGILIVDEAHGAHFCLMEQGMKSAYECGADLVIESLHKTLPALTQCAVLHLQGKRVEAEKVSRALEVFETSSPSYLLMASIDSCLKEMQTNGKEKMNSLLRRIRSLKEQIGELKHIRILGNELVGNNGVWKFDETKLLFSVLNSNISGKELADYLRKEYGIELEMETPTYGLALCSIDDSEESIELLGKAVKEIDEKIHTVKRESIEFSYKENERMLSMYEASNCKTESVFLENAAGQISGEFIYFYPPGIPLIVPGEVLSNEVLKQIAEAGKRGIIVNGLKDYEQKKIEVIKQ